MSHLQEREEKVCLNCKAPLIGRYCHDCGQENVDPKESFGHLLRHFFEDLTHFDGKFFNTCKLLLTKPGFLAEEYMYGRRVSYLNPIRMYIFVSAVFFIIFFSFFHRVETMNATGKWRISLPSYVYDENTGKAITTVKEYDSLQATLPVAERDGHFSSFAARKLVSIQELANKDFAAALARIVKPLLNAFPKIMFVTMPLFALLLYLIYYKRRDKYYYVAHGIFTLHLFTAQFIMLSVIFILLLIPGINTFFLTSLLLLLTLTLGIYTYLAMLRFYKENPFKTLRRFITLQSLYSILSLIIFAAAAYILSLYNSSHH